MQSKKLNSLHWWLIVECNVVTRKKTLACFDVWQSLVRLKVRLLNEFNCLVGLSTVADPGGPQGAMAPPNGLKKKIFFTLPKKKFFFKFFLHNFLNYWNYPPRIRIHGTSSTTPPRIRAGKLHQLPPLESTEPHRLPPSNSGRKTPSTTPPRIHGTSSTTPLRIRAGKLLDQLPPPRIHGRNGNSPPPPNSIPRSAPG